MPELTDIESKTFSARDFRLESGKTLPVLQLAYETYGALSPAKDNAILVVHGYTSSHHAAGRNAAGKGGGERGTGGLHTKKNLPDRGQSSEVRTSQLRQTVIFSFQLWAAVHSQRVPLRNQHRWPA